MLNQNNTGAEIARLPLSSLVAAYNSAVPDEKRIQKFRDRDTAVQRIERLLEGPMRQVVLRHLPTEHPGVSEEPADAVSDEKSHVHPDDYVITLLARKNPKRRGTDCHRRFNFYRTGLTVGEYLDLCEGTGHMPARHKYRADLRWDEKQGFVRIAAPAS